MVCRIAVILLSLATVACGSDGGMLEMAGVVQEVEEARAATSVPEGQTLDIPRFSEDDLYEPGFGYMVVQTQAACLWMREWIEARADGEEDAQQEAWTFIEGIPDLKYFEAAGSNHQENTRDRIERAALGDPSGIAAYVQANCSRAGQ